MNKKTSQLKRLGHLRVRRLTQAVRPREIYFSWNNPNVTEAQKS